MAGLKRWFVQKYQLPPTHHLFEGRSEADLTVEMLEDFYAKAQSLRTQAENVEGAGSEKTRDVLYTQLNDILRLLGEPSEVFDPVVAKWDADFDAGLVPDLTRR